jgi:hypothetical protein
MRGLILVCLTAWLSACGGNGTFQGRFLDGVSGEPRAGVRVVAKAIGGTNDMTCMAREATSEASGSFVLQDLCSGLSYSLSLPDPSLQLGGKVAVRGGEASVEAADLKVWRAPNGSGLYRLTNDKIYRIKTWSDVAEVKSLGKGLPIRYPVMKPTPKTRLPTVRPGDHLLISSAEDIQRLRFVPVVPSEGLRRFQGTSITNHVYLGIKFTTDTLFNPVQVTVDESKVVKVVSGKRAYRYMSHDALPAGRYAVLSDKDNVTYMVDFSG